MKIFFVVYNIYGVGGTVRTVVNTANFFAQKGYTVEIISIKRTSKIPIFSIDNSVKLTPLYDSRKGKFLHPNAPLYKKIIKRTLTKTKSVLIHSDEDLYKMFSLQTDIKLINKLKSIKEGVLITTIPSFNILAAKYVNNNVFKIGQEHKEFESHSKELQKKIKKYYPKLDVLTCLTDITKKKYTELFNDRLRIEKIENATPVIIEKATLQEKMIVTAGRLVPEKGYDRLIESFKEVIKIYPDWKLKIYGEGLEKELLQEQILDNNLYNHVFLMGRTNNIYDVLSKASIHAVSSREESFGMVIIEAMSVGIPTISFDCEGPIEIIKNGYDGIIVKQGDILGFTNALVSLIENEELRKKMGERIEESIKKYSMDVIGSKWENLVHLDKN